MHLRRDAQFAGDVDSVCQRLISAVGARTDAGREREGRDGYMGIRVRSGGDRSSVV